MINHIGVLKEVYEGIIKEILRNCKGLSKKYREPLPVWLLHHHPHQRVQSSAPPAKADAYCAGYVPVRVFHGAVSVVLLTP